MDNLVRPVTLDDFTRELQEWKRRLHRDILRACVVELTESPPRRTAAELCALREALLREESR